MYRKRYPDASRRDDVVFPLTPAHLQMGSYVEDMIPTVGFNMRKVTKGKVGGPGAYLGWHRLMLLGSGLCASAAF